MDKKLVKIGEAAKSCLEQHQTRYESGNQRVNYCQNAKPKVVHVIMTWRNNRLMI